MDDESLKRKDLAFTDIDDLVKDIDSPYSDFIIGAGDDDAHYCACKCKCVLGKCEEFIP